MLLLRVAGTLGNSVTFQRNRKRNWLGYAWTVYSQVVHCKVMHIAKDCLKFPHTNGSDGLW
jgi:hypothetical protein